MSFPRYESYKDSGIEWLGEVPEHWELKRVRHLIRQGYDGLKIGPFGSQLTSQMLVETSNYKVFGQENVIVDDFTRGERFISEEKFQELSVYEVKPGDILITMMGTSGRCAIVPDSIATGIMDSHLLRMRVTDGISPRFLQLLIDESAYVAHQIQILGKGSIMHGLNSSIIKELVLTVPPIIEQHYFLSFLDRETAKIDALIAEQQRLIELLKEKRQAVISHAVTKGLNPDAPMKDTGIEWLGEVPEHWSVCALNYRFQVELGKMLDDKQITGEHLSPYLRNIDVQWGTINTNELPEMDFHGNDLVRYRLKLGDLLVCEGGDVGRAAIWRDEIEECYYQKALHRLRARTPETDVAEFFYFVLYSAATRGVFSESGKSTIAHLTADNFRHYRFPFPPHAEQVVIAAFLNCEIAKFDALATEANRAVTLLQERRTALISAAVTGKIDVRGLAEAQPEMEAAA